MKMKGLGLVGIIFLQLFLAQGANIMFFCGMASYSHRVGIWPLVEKLADRGHSLTFVSSFKSKGEPNPKVTDYVPKSLKDWSDGWNETTRNFYDLRKTGELEQEWFTLPGIGLVMCTILMNDPQYVDWIRKSKFDLIFVDALSNECAYGMAYLLKAKIIVFSTADMFPHFVDPFGIPDESSWVPDMVHHFSEDMTLYQRFVSLAVPLIFTYIREVQVFPQMESLIREKLQIPEMPSLSEIERNVSLVFLNHHYAEDYARPLPPHVIPVAGMQCSATPEKISKELEVFINKGKSGFIYISFGSYADLSTFPKETQDVFLNTVKKLKDIQFVWKLDVDKLNWKNLPPNVYTAKWMPQQALLGHQKVRGFITHGGLFGIQEAICSSVPLIAFPIFAEQDYNAVKVQNRGIGIKLEITTVTKNQLGDAINKILTDGRYHKKMKALSVAFRDRPAKPEDTAVWWTEFVLRHDDTDFLRPSSLRQPWWKRRQLDILAILFLIALIVLKVVYTIIKSLLGLLFGSGKKEKKEGKKLKSS